MRNWSRAPKRKGRIEIIPMIDVMMFLLVFFVLISVNVIPALGIKTQLPNSSQAQSLTTPVKQVVVSIGLDEHIVVDGAAVTLANLSQAVRNSAHGAQKVSVILNSDQGVVVQRLIEVMDELKSKGWDTQSIAAHRREANPT
jgi:biopolymer transport protein ExbD